MKNTDAAKQAFERALENPSPPSFALVIDILRQQLCWTASQLREMHRSVARYFPGTCPYPSIVCAVNGMLPALVDRQHVLDLDVLKTILAFPEHTAGLCANRIAVQINFAEPKSQLLIFCSHQRALQHYRPNRCDIFDDSDVQRKGW